MRILALPARQNRKRNPYNAILSDRLEEKGWRVEEASIGSALFQKADIVHVHWPQAPASAPFLLAVRRSFSLLALLILQKLRGARNIWTVHNVRSHEQRRPAFETVLMKAVIRLLDGYLVLNRHTRGSATAIYPRLASLPWALVPHFVYGAAYPPPPERAAAQQRLGIPSDLPVVGFVGELKSYKGLDRALSGILATPPGSLRALIAGSFKDGNEAERFRRQVDDASKAGHDIRLQEGFLDDDQLVVTMAACDLLLLPYASASNSGFAILAGELGVPMLLADTPVFRDLAEELGEPTCVAADGFSGEEVRRAAEAAKRAGAIPPPVQFLETRSQIRTAASTDEFFRSVIRPG